MPPVLGQVVESVVRVEQQVLAPLVGDAVDEDLPNLKPHDFMIGVALRSGCRRRSENLAARSQRDQRLVTHRFLVLLKDRDGWIFGIENRSTALADDVDGVAERADRGGRPAVRTIDWSDADRRASLAVRHRYQPSKVRTFLSRSASKSIALPM